MPADHDFLAGRHGPVLAQHSRRNDRRQGQDAPAWAASLSNSRRVTFVFRISFYLRISMPPACPVDPYVRCYTRRPPPIPFSAFGGGEAAAERGKGRFKGGSHR